MSRPRTGNKRQRLIDAAVRLFARKGYFYTTTAEVSAQAGVASGTLYLYFNSKDDLLAAALNEFLEAFEREVLPAAKQSDDTRSGLQAFVSSFMEFVTQKQDLARVFLRGVPPKQQRPAFAGLCGRVQVLRTDPHVPGVAVGRLRSGRPR